MKKILISLTLLLPIAVFAQTELTVDAVPDKVTVFLSGAQIFQSKNISLSAGSTNIIVQGIANTIDVNSIQAGGTGDFTILDVQFRNYYPEPVGDTKVLTEIQKKILIENDSLAEINFQYKDIANQREVLNVEKTFLMNNKMLLGQGKSDSLKLIQQSVDYYDKKLNEIYFELLALDRKEAKLNGVRDGIARRMAELQAFMNQNNTNAPQLPIPQIIVSVVADHSTSGKIEINYVTYNAGWVASYDIRANDVNSPVQLNYKANVWQQTGINWKDVKLTCSTGNPMLGNSLPELTTWYLGYYQAYYDDYYKEKNLSAPESATDRGADIDQSNVAGYLKKDEAAKTSTNYTTMNQNIANVDFEVDLPYTIPGDGKGHLVSLQTSTLNATYNYLIVPKLDESAFLIARVTGWENAHLLPGYANIYYKNTYVGKTDLNPLALNDTLPLALGRDRAVEVKRTQLLDKSTDRIIGLNNKKTMTFEISVRNGKANDIEVVIKDQIPIAQESGIKVEVNEDSDGELNEATGIITWNTTLKAKETKKYELGFEVTYPKNQTLSIL